MITDRVVGGAAQKQSGQLTEPRSDRMLRFACYVVSLIWVGFTLFPIYWLLTSTFKDPVDVMKMPPDMLPRLPSTYTVQLDFTEVAKENPASLEQVIREDMALAAWRVPDLMPRIHLGKVAVEGFVDGRKVADAAMPLYQYEQYRGHLWVTQRLSDRLVLRELDLAHFPTGLEIALDGALKPRPVGDATEFSDKVADLFGSEIGVTSRLLRVAERRDPWSLVNNYVTAWQTPGRRYPGLTIGQYFSNSVKITGTEIVLQWVLSGLSAYALSRLLTPGWARMWTIFFLVTMMVPSVTTLIPTYEMVGKMGMQDTLWGVILPSIPNPFSIYLFKGFFDALPQELFDAARIDGASEFRIFSRITMPMSKNVFTVIGLLTFLSSWNAFFWPLLVLRSPINHTFNVAIYFSMASARQDGSLGSAMATAVIAALPTVIVFAIFSRSIQQGLVWSGLKG